MSSKMHKRAMHLIAMGYEYLGNGLMKRKCNVVKGWYYKSYEPFNVATIYDQYGYPQGSYHFHWKGETK